LTSDAVTLGAASNVPALTIGVGNISFLACALGAFDTLLAVPYLVHGAGAGWDTVRLVADVGVLVAGTFTWAGLEGTAGRAGNCWCALVVDNLLHAFICAEHVSAVDAWDFNLLVVLVEFAVVVAWAG